MNNFSANDAILYYDLQFVFSDQVYAPSDDTDLMVKHLMEWIHNQQKNPKILEIGSGPGTLSLILADQLVKKDLIPIIVGIDINPEAVAVANFNAVLNHLEAYCSFIEGDLFNPLITLQSEDPKAPPFDLIFFNPPYLPGDEELINSENRQLIDSAWEGGPIGDEILLRFLTNVTQFLIPQGEIYIISSSIVEQDGILACIQQNRLKVVEIDKIHIFFEDIILYHLNF
jgi:release factor glutamine methyltransferase